jgi:hypothetical protein
VPLANVWKLAQGWYWDRMEPGWRRKTATEAAEVFAGAGLVGEFWGLG